MYRTHTCNQLRKSDIGQTVTLSGWVNSRRDHGGVIFIDLRDREGMTQVVFRPDEQPQVAEASHGLRGEDVVKVTGLVAARLDGTENAKLETGDIEVVATELQVLSKADVPPFPLDQEIGNEDLRLSHRYLDLRRPAMARNLRAAPSRRKGDARLPRCSRDFWKSKRRSCSKSTPEGARDFLVPSRLNPGTFYALPQAPQQYKQLLMVGGIDRYFQIAKCFRDEDLRADRQPEFTQIDIEASFVTPDDIYSLIEGLLARDFQGGQRRRTPDAVPADDLFRGDEPVRQRQAGHAFRDGDRRSRRRVRGEPVQGFQRRARRRRRGESHQREGLREHHDRAKSRS